MAVTTGATEIWQARIGRELAAALRADSEVLGLNGRTDRFVDEGMHGHRNIVHFGHREKKPRPSERR